jgi:hypothetical protein
LTRFRAVVPFNGEDRVMYREIDRAVEFLVHDEPEITT